MPQTDFFMYGRGAQQGQVPNNPTKHLLGQFVSCSEDKTYLRYLLCDVNVIYIWLIVMKRQLKQFFVELNKTVLGK
jgi:hypothetical protein